MGNSGLRKIILPSDVVETQYHSLYDISTIDLDKNEVPLSQFKDKITLCVNVSSQHSETATQVAELKQLASLFPKSDFEVLAFPCNQFANEPENFRNLKRNYFDKFAVNFPVFAKIEVNGTYTHPVFKFLRRHSDLYKVKQLSAANISEDFSKFLVNNKGEVKGFYDRRVGVDTLTHEIQRLIEEKKQVVLIKTDLIKEAVPK